MSLVVAAADLHESDVAQMVGAHLAFSRDVTPPGHVHALPIDGLSDASVIVLAARLDGRLVGIGALRVLDDRHAEIKSMHVAAAERRRGVGRALLARLVALAEARGCERVSLETGTAAAFGPARSLYRRESFAPCEPFGDYTTNPNSLCMTRPVVSLTGRSPADELKVRPAVVADLPAITEILNALLATHTYEWTETPHSVEERRAWMMQHAAAGEPVLVAVVDSEVVGWAAYGEFRDTRRWPGYWPTVEHSIHVRQDAWRRGVGRALLAALVEHALLAGKRVMVAAIDGANQRSIVFHERLGFTIVGRLAGTGEKFDRELDLVLMQRTLAP
jgi:L-amino acid N-acyltransferase YncA